MAWASKPSAMQTHRTRRMCCVASGDMPRRHPERAHDPLGDSAGACTKRTEARVSTSSLFPAIRSAAASPPRSAGRREASVSQTYPPGQSRVQPPRPSLPSLKCEGQFSSVSLTRTHLYPTYSVPRRGCDQHAACSLGARRPGRRRSSGMLPSANLALSLTSWCESD
jgi:hypothetical protein